MRLIGQIEEINRYPVKSFRGERLGTAQIETYGLHGDRCYAFVDETKEDWDRFVTARKIPEMLGYQAKLAGKGSEDKFPDVTVESPDGRTFAWDEDLLAEMQRHSKVKLSMIDYKPSSTELLAVDTGSIHIITDSSLRKLEAMWGKQLDKRRFRANLVVSLLPDTVDEHGWLGKRLAVGTVEFAVDIFCERCSMITFDPDTQERDISLLRTVNEEMNLNFGVYAFVKTTGNIHVGDSVFLVD